MYKITVEYDTGPHSSMGEPAGDRMEYFHYFHTESEARTMFDFLCHVVDLGVSISLYAGDTWIDGCELTDMPGD